MLRAREPFESIADGHSQLDSCLKVHFTAHIAALNAPALMWLKLTKQVASNIFSGSFDSVRDVYVGDAA